MACEANGDIICKIMRFSFFSLICFVQFLLWCACLQSPQRPWKARNQWPLLANPRAWSSRGSSLASDLCEQYRLSDSNWWPALFVWTQIWPQPLKTDPSPIFCQIALLLRRVYSNIMESILRDQFLHFAGILGLQSHILYYYFNKKKIEHL